MAGEQHLTARVDVQGADKGAADFHKVADAQDRFTQKITEAAPPLDEFTTAQTKATAAVGDYAELGSRVNPMLGAFIASMEKGAKIAGDLATKQMTLRGTFSALASGIEKYSGVLGLLGAGGLAYGGVIALTWAINQHREAVAKLREEEQRRKDAQAEEVKLEDEAVTQMRELSRLRKEKGFTAEEETQAREMYRMEAPRFAADLQDELRQNIVAGIGLVTREEMRRVTAAGETIDIAGSQEKRARDFERRHRRERLERAEEEEERRAEADKEMRRQRMREDISGPEAEQFLKEGIWGLSEEDRKEVLETAETYKRKLAKYEQDAQYRAITIDARARLAGRTPQEQLFEEARRETGVGLGLELWSLIGGPQAQEWGFSSAQMQALEMLLRRTGHMGPSDVTLNVNIAENKQYNATVHAKTGNERVRSGGRN